jgi:hypothetical protein
MKKMSLGELLEKSTAQAEVKVDAKRRTDPAVEAMLAEIRRRRLAYQLGKPCKPVDDIGGQKK